MKPIETTTDRIRRLSENYTTDDLSRELLVAELEALVLSAQIDTLRESNNKLIDIKSLTKE